MFNNTRRIDYKDPILQDKELVQMVAQALGDKKQYGSGNASIEKIRARLHNPVPLVEMNYKVQRPRELRDTGRTEELIMTLKFINNEISISDFHEFRDYKQEENLAKNTIGPRNILNLKR